MQSVSCTQFAEHWRKWKTSFKVQFCFESFEKCDINPVYYYYSTLVVTLPISDLFTDCQAQWCMRKKLTLRRGGGQKKNLFVLEIYRSEGQQHYAVKGRPWNMPVCQFILIFNGKVWRLNVFIVTIRRYNGIVRGFSLQYVNYIQVYSQIVQTRLFFWKSLRMGCVWDVRVVNHSPWCVWMFVIVLGCVVCALSSHWKCDSPWCVCGMCTQQSLKVVPENAAGLLLQAASVDGGGAGLHMVAQLVKMLSVDVGHSILWKRRQVH